MSTLFGKRAERFLSVLLSVTVIVWSLGLFALTASVASAATLNEGDIIRGPDGIKVYIINAKGFKRHIFNPEVFNMYGHLKWSNIKAVDQTTLDSYKTSDLYRADGDQKVYQTADDGIKRWFNVTGAEFMTKYTFDQVFVVNPKERDFYATGSEILASELGAVVTAGLSVSLDSSSPAASAVAQGAADANYTAIKLNNGSSADVVISSIAIKRSGLSANADVSNIKLYEGATQVGSTQALNSTTNKATFGGLNLSLPKNTSKVIMIKATVPSTGATAGNLVQLGVDSASDIVGATFTGAPVYGNAKTVAGIGTGSLTVDTLTSPAGDVISGATDQWVGSVKLTAGSTEGINVTSLKVTLTGTSVDSDISNLKLKIGGAQVGSAVAALSSKSATFDLSSSPISIIASGNKTVDVYANIASGVNVQRTIITEVTQASHITVIGNNSGGSITAVAAGSFPEQGGTITIKQGSLSVAADATNPTAQTYVKGTTNDTVLALKFSAGSAEGVRITEIKLTEGNAAQADTDMSNVSLWDGTTQIGTYGSLSAGVVTFGSNTLNSYDNPGLFDIPASGTKVITVKADVPTGAATLSGTWGLKINAHADVKGDGLSSQNDLPACTSCTVATVAHSTSTNGSLAVSLNSATPAAANVSKTTTGITVAKYDLTSTGEDISVTSLTIRGYKGAGTGTVLPTGDITNVKVMDGTTQIGSTVTNPTTGVVTVSGALTVAKNTTKTISVVLDVPSTTSLVDTNTFHFDLPGAGTIADDITSSGVSSGATFSETGSATGNLFTLKDPTLTLTSAGTPVVTTHVVNSTDVIVYSLNLTAGTAEDVKVSSATFAADDAAISGAATASTASASWSTFKLYDGGTQLGSTKNLTDGTPDSVTFDSFTVTVPKGTTKTLDLRAKAVGSATAWYFGITTAANQVIAVGSSSNTSITTTLGTAITSTAQTLGGGGTLTTVVDSGKPVAKNVAVGTSGKDGVEFSKFRMTANTENITLKTLTLTRTSGADADFKSNGVKLYDGATLLGSATLGATTAAKATFNFTGSESWQPLFIKDTDKVLTIKADLNGISAGATSADAPKLEIAATTDVVATGYSSGTTINGSAATTTNNAMAIYKSTITVAANSSSPTGLQTAGALKEVLRFNVTADAAAPAYIESFAITPNTNAAVTADTGNDVQVFWDLDNYATALQAGDFSASAADICVANDSGVGVALTTAIKLTVLSTGATAAAGNTCNAAVLEIAAGATRTFVVKMDTTGAVNPKTLSNDIAAIADLVWRDTSTGSAISTLTSGLPFTGNTLSY